MPYKTIPPRENAGRYDLFQGRYPTSDVFWLESVEGLAEANVRMREAAARNPGTYFVFDPHNSVVVAKIDTTK